MEQKQQYDIITVGGGVAGSAFATAMARQGEQSDASEQTASDEDDTVSVEAISEAGTSVADNSGEIMSVRTASTLPTPALASEAERRAIGEAFVNALVERDFERLDSLLATLSDSRPSGAGTDGLRGGGRPTPRRAPRSANANL